MWSRYRLHDPHVSYAFEFLFVTAQVRFPGSGARRRSRRCTSTGRTRRPVPGVVARHGHLPRGIARLPGRSVLIGGDFNATPDAAQFRTIVAQGYADAADQAGAGFTPTWPADRWSRRC